MAGGWADRGHRPERVVAEAHIDRRARPSSEPRGRPQRPFPFRARFPQTLLDDLMSEGLATAFDLQIQPRLSLPFMHVLNASQERRLWARATPLLGDAGEY